MPVSAERRACFVINGKFAHDRRNAVYTDDYVSASDNAALEKSIGDLRRRKSRWQASTSASVEACRLAIARQCSIESIGLRNRLADALLLYTLFGGRRRRCRRGINAAQFIYIQSPQY